MRGCPFRRRPIKQRLKHTGPSKGGLVCFLAKPAHFTLSPPLPCFRHVLGPFIYNIQDPENTRTDRIGFNESNKVTLAYDGHMSDMFNFIISALQSRFHLPNIYIILNDLTIYTSIPSWRHSL